MTCMNVQRNATLKYELQLIVTHEYAAARLKMGLMMCMTMQRDATRIHELQLVVTH